MISIKWKARLFIALIAISNGNADAASRPHARLLNAPEQKDRISGLTWISKGLTFRKTKGEKAGETSLKVTLRGKFLKPEWTLIASKDKVKIRDRGAFDIAVPVVSEITRITFMAIGPRGELEKEVVLIRSDPSAWERYGLGKKPNKGQTGLSLNAGLGWTYLSYREDPRGIRLSELALTPKVTAGYPLIREKLDIGANVFFNVISLTHSPETVNSARFLGINGRIGYTLPVDWAGATWKLLTGWYFWTMRTEGRLYGVDLLSGPQLFLSAAKGGKGRRAWYGYFKYAPIGDMTEGISLKNREFALGGGYQIFDIDSPRRWMITLDLSDARFSSIAQGNALALFSATLGIQTALY